MIIGLTGQKASGKGIVAQHLKKSGFNYYIFSDVISEECTKRGIDSRREHLRVVGNELRERHGSAILAKEILKKIKKNKDKKVVIDGFRNPCEIEVYRKANDDGEEKFYLIALESPPKVRFERIVARNRAGDVKTYEEFLENDKKENAKSGSGQQISNCIKMADDIIINDSTKNALFDKIDKIIEKALSR